MPVFRRLLARKLEQVESIDPERIYVENVRTFFGFPHQLAKLMLDTAVLEGALERRVGVLCPHDKHIVQSFSSEKAVPESVFCFACEAEGREPTDHPRGELGQLTFYKLVSSENG